MTKKLKPADEIDAYCTKCKLDLSHRIVSLDGDKPHQVECQTCRSTHRYRRPKSVTEEPRTAKATSTSSSSSSAGGTTPTGKPSSAKAIAAAEAENLRERDWERRVSGKGLNEFKPYRTTTTFNANELIRHAKFGDGFVTRVVDKNKIEVMFRDGLRTLAHGLDMG